jgi:hypothetical protein
MMTKRRDIIKIIATAATDQGMSFTVTREGSRHTVYDSRHTVYDLDGINIPIARHNEIGNRMAEVIYKEAAGKLGNGLVEEMSRKTYSYNVTRDGRFWLIHVPELDRFTQARNLREVDEMVVDLISVITDQPTTSFDCQLGVIELPESVTGHLDIAKQLREQAARSEHDAAEEARPRALRGWCTAA